MPESTSASVLTLVRSAKGRLDADAGHIRRLVEGVRPFDDLPPAVYAALADARRDALISFGQVAKLPLGDRGRDRALTWLSLAAAAFGDTYVALRAEQLKSPSATRSREKARAAFRTAHRYFLALDRELGCPFGCGRRR